MIWNDPIPSRLRRCLLAVALLGLAGCLPAVEPGVFHAGPPVYRSVPPPAYGYYGVPPPSIRVFPPSAFGHRPPHIHGHVRPLPSGRWAGADLYRPRPFPPRWGHDGYRARSYPYGALYRGNGRCDDPRYETSNGGRARPGTDEYDCSRHGDGLKGRYR